MQEAYAEVKTEKTPSCGYIATRSRRQRGKTKLEDGETLTNNIIHTYVIIQYVQYESTAASAS